MELFRGTALYCGIGYGLDEMEKHLKMAASVGINAVFTSIQLPEANPRELHRDFPKMAEIAHKYGIKVFADLGPKTASQFGIDMFDLKAIKEFGIDVLRIDAGYTLEQKVQATKNDLDMVICLNPNVDATEENMQKMIELGINKENVTFCYNYHPMKYSGMKFEKAKAKSDIIHKYGFRVAGFLASNHHRRIGCGFGLPTLERHRGMDIFAQAQEGLLAGYDDIFMGDDLASEDELKCIVAAKKEHKRGPVNIRFRPYVKGEVLEWLNGRSLKLIQCGLDEIIRTAFWDKESIYPGGYEDGLPGKRSKGDVCMCKASLLRYAGEVQLVKMDLPEDKDIGIIGRIIDEDIPILDVYNDMSQFRLIAVE
jgi:hypothetical protein